MFDLGSEVTRSSRNEKDAFLELERLARQRFLYRLSNKEVCRPVEKVFYGMSTSDTLYQHAMQEVRELYKQWKCRTLEHARTFFDTWLAYNEWMMML